jgi:hypothetical protein
MKDVVSGDGRRESVPFSETMEFVVIPLTNKCDQCRIVTRNMLYDKFLQKTKSACSAFGILREKHSMPNAICRERP